MSTTTVALKEPLTYLQHLIQRRMKTFFATRSNGRVFSLPALDEVVDSRDSILQTFLVQGYQLNTEEYFLLLIALAPHLDPTLFDHAIQEGLPKAGDFPQIGGARGKNFRGFLPTGETALFLLAGSDFLRRREVTQLFGEDHFFAKRRILWIEDAPEGEPRMSSRIILSQEYIELFTLGKVSRPRFSMRFPAQLIETELEWDDLVLNTDTLKQVLQLENYLKYGKTLLDDWEMRRKLKPGYRVLFHGPPGTGKTLTASLLGKHTGKNAFKIDLSMVVSKFIGETEKNLANLFAKAESKDWILFFDEADALFGKRTNVRDAHDKYANQEVSYLLQRVENYDGLVILATNFLSNIDDAFKRRFQSIIQFPFPTSNERLILWRKAFPKRVQLTKEVNLAAIAQRYELSGAEIMNIVQYCCLQALERGDEKITSKDIVDGIRKEYLKEGKILN